jgi:2'-5' RNA ligase
LSVRDAGPGVAVAKRRASTHLTSEFVAATAIVVPVPEADSVVDLLRRNNTLVGAEGMPSHVTLIYPFIDNGILTSGRVGDVREVVEQFREFRFELRSVGRFRGGQESHLWLAPVPGDPFIEIVRALEARFPEYPSFAGEFRDVVPHLTVASSPDESLLDQIQATLTTALPLGAVAREVRIMEYVGDQWRVKARLPLAKPEAPEVDE